ncbi:MAG: endo alpha-1,4 polygalactosaminidase [Hyphomicrobiaceae bacterium]|nr:endo alpha-1,4 polygalactosaminidase [Hyphomicrobiaceae bacterium]
MPRPFRHITSPGRSALAIPVAVLLTAVLALVTVSVALAATGESTSDGAGAAIAELEPPVPRPVPARRPSPEPLAPSAPAAGQLTTPKVLLRSATDIGAAAKRRQTSINAVTSWGYQLAGLDVATAAASPYDLLVVDGTTGLGDGDAMTPDDVARLKRKPDGTRRLVVSYLSIGEAEDYRPDYFDKEYLAEDAPDWLMQENPEWKGNRIIRFCEEGWQQTILGDDEGRSVYNSIDPSPLYRLIELGLDGVYLDRVDVYAEVTKLCPDAAARMVRFVKRLAEHARKRNPDFIVILQNAEELLVHADMIASIDAIAKEDLYYGVDHSEKSNDAEMVRSTVAHLRRARAAGRPVFFVDYVASKAKSADAARRGRTEGFIPYFAPRDLGRLWLPGRQF